MSEQRWQLLRAGGVAGSQQERGVGGQCETEETHLDAQKSMLSVENRQAIYLVSEGIRHGGQMCVRWRLGESKQLTKEWEAPQMALSFSYLFPNSSFTYFSPFIFCSSVNRQLLAVMTTTAMSLDEQVSPL